MIQRHGQQLTCEAERRRRQQEAEFDVAAGWIGFRWIQISGVEMGEEFEI